jgi:hypothetical protein
MLFGADLRAMDQVDLAEHANQVARLVDNGESADIVLRQELDRIGNIGMGRTVTTSRTMTSIARMSPASE